MATAEVSPDRDGDVDHIDSCVCDIGLHDGEVTPDVDLPAATGGVENIGPPAQAGEGIDGCDVDFIEFATTRDEDLPITVGGVG